MKLKNGILSFLLLMPCASFAQDDSVDIESGWLLPEIGSTESVLGARVHSITETETAGIQRIEVSIPDSELVLEEVIVIGKRPDIVFPIDQHKRFEYIKDIEQGRHGIIIYLGKLDQFALRLNYFEGNPRFPYD